MRGYGRRGAVRVKAILILVGIVAGLAIGVLVAHRARKHMIASSALTQGRAALAKQDWPVACTQLRLYLSKYPDDLSVLREYAEANLAIEPREPDRIAAAIGAYRRLLRRQPENSEVLQTLTRLYVSVGNLEDAAFICGQRLDVQPDDAFALLWLSRAKAVGNQPDEAAQLLRRLVERHPTEIRAYLMLADLALRGSGTVLRSVSPGGSDDAAREWLDKAVAANPGWADPLVRRARLMRTANGAGDDRAIAGSASSVPSGAFLPNADGAQRVPAAILADLDAASHAKSREPLMLIELVEEWMAWDDLDRANDALARVEAVGPGDLAGSDVERPTFELLRYTTAIELALRRDEGERAAAAADAGLAVLTSQRRAVFLPQAVRAFLAASRLPDAVAALDEYAKTDAARERGPDDEQLALLQAQVLLADNKPGEAAQRLALVGGNGFQNPVGFRLLSRAYARLGRTGPARTALAKYIELRGTDREAILDLATMCRHKDWDQVRELAERAHRMKPSFRSAMLLAESEVTAAEEASNEGLAEHAARQLQQLAPLAPDQPAPMVLLARALTVLGRVADAESAWQAALDRSHSSSEVRMAQAAWLAERGRVNEARIAFEAVIESTPSAAAPRLQLASLLDQTGDAEGADRTLQTAAADVPASEQGPIQLAIAQRALRSDPSRSAELLENYLTQTPHDAAAIEALLVNPVVRRDPARVDRWVDALRAAEGDQGANWKFHAAAARLSEPNWQASAKEIDDLLSDCLRAEPTWDRAAAAKGLLLERLGKLRDAESFYRSYLARTPRSPAVTERLTAVLERQGKFAEADQLASSSGGRTNGRSAERRVDELVQRGDVDAAIELLEKATVDDPADEQPRLRLAELLLSERDDAERASEVLEQVSATGDQAGAVARLRALLLHRQKQTDKAIALLGERVELGANDAAAARMLRGQLLVDSGRAAEAERDFRAAADADPTHGIPALAGFLDQQRRSADARGVWENATRQFPQDTELRRGFVRRLVQGEAADRGRAAELLEALQADSPNDAELARLRATLLLSSEAPTALADAERCLDAALAVSPGDVPTALMRANLARHRGDWDRARAVVASATDAHGASAPLTALQVAIEVDAGSISLAIGLANSAMDRSPTDWRLALELARLFLRANDAGTATTFVERAKSTRPDRLEVRLAWADCLQAKGRAELAIEYLGAAAASCDARERSHLLLSLADAQLAGDRPDDALRTLDRIEAPSRDQCVVDGRRIQVFAAKRDFDGVLATVQRLREAKLADGTVLITAASALLHSESDEHARRAKAMFVEAAGADPKNLPAALGVAQASLRLSERDEAIAAYRRVLSESDGFHAQALNDLAWLLAESDDAGALSEADELSNRGTQRYPRDVHLLHTRGFVLAKLGKLPQARREFERCVSLSANSPATQAAALLDLIEVLQRLGGEVPAVNRVADQLRRLDQATSALSDEQRSRLERLVPTQP